VVSLRNEIATIARQRACLREAPPCGTEAGFTAQHALGARNGKLFNAFLFVYV